MTFPRSLRVPALAIGVSAVHLLFASGAGAETVIGESTTIAAQEGTPSPEITLVRASASYEPSAGNLSLAVVTGAAPQPELGAEPNESNLFAMFVKTTAACSVAGLDKALEGTDPSIFSIAVLRSAFAEPTTAEGLVATPPAVLPIQKAVSGTTTTFTTQTSALADQEFNCASVSALGPTQSDLTAMVFAMAPAPPPPAPPAPAPASLSIARPKPLKLRVGKWRTVKVKITNTSGTDAEQGALRIKAPKGVVVKPEKQKLPALAAGASWRLSVRVELTKKAKKKSTLSLTADAAGVIAKSALVLKRKSSRSR